MFESLDDASAGRVRRWEAPRMELRDSMAARLRRSGGDGGRGAGHGDATPAAPAPDDAATRAGESPGENTEASIDARLGESFDRGYALGRDEAEVAARADGTHDVGALIAALGRERERLDAALEEDLLELARAMARLIVRREIERDAGVLRDVLHEALAGLPRLSGQPTVRLNPDDAAALTALAPEEGVTIVADGTLERGDCRIEAGASRIDAGIDAWVSRIASRQGALEPRE